jgi:hypothetical protein
MVGLKTIAQSRSTNVAKILTRFLRIASCVLGSITTFMSDWNLRADGPRGSFL